MGKKSQPAEQPDRVSQQRWSPDVFNRLIVDRSRPGSTAIDSHLSLSGFNQLQRCYPGSTRGVENQQETIGILLLIRRCLLSLPGLPLQMPQRPKRSAFLIRAKCRLRPLRLVPNKGIELRCEFDGCVHAVAVSVGVVELVKTLFEVRG